LNKDLPQIEALAKQCENVVLHRNVTKMSELMRACDLAVSASGSTLYELCACGVPTVTYVLADNQVRAAKAFAEQGIMISIGDIREKPDFVKEIMLSINELRKNSLLRQTLREKMRSVTDGKGANYTITEIKNILKGEK